jgi:hypothetical protein
MARATTQRIREWGPVVLLGVIALALVVGLFRQRADVAKREEMEADAARLSEEVRRVVEETNRLQKSLAEEMAQAEGASEKLRAVLEKCGVRIEGSGPSSRVVIPPGQEAAVRECVQRAAAAPCASGRCR